MPELSGHIVFHQNEWKNKILGTDHGVPLSRLSHKQFLHIGYHRTGTTLLQKHIFPRYVHYSDIFSNESISGAYFNNGLNNIDKIYKIVPKAKIIIVIRNQANIINSSYRTYVRAGGIYSFDKYAEKIIEFGRYDYTKLILGYYERFEKKNCTVFLYEDLRNDPHAFVSSILSLMNIESIYGYPTEKVNQGPTKYYNEYVRWINIFVNKLSLLKDNKYRSQKNYQSTESIMDKLRKTLLYLGALNDEKIIRKMINDKNNDKQIRYEKAKNNIRLAYSDSNKKLEKMINRNLKEYGYI